MAILELKDLCCYFGGLKAVEKFNTQIKKNELVGLIGPNGAGKTTVFNVLTGIYPPTSGEVIFQEENIGGLLSHKITQKGIVRTFQNIRIFPALTVLENIIIAYHFRTHYSIFSGILRDENYHREEEEMNKQAMELLRLFDLHTYYQNPAGSLPYGEQRKLEIARALATKPSMLLLDEPAAGMNPYETIKLMELVKKIKEDFQLTIFLIEHHMQFVMGICERIMVMDFGVQIAEGTPQEIQKNPTVIGAYLGEEKKDVKNS